jgi:hypothetical protein
VSINLISHYLSNEWQNDIDGRSVEVPTIGTNKPYIVTEKADSRSNTKKNDIIIVKDGGLEERSPASLHYDAESSTSFVQLDIRTADRNRPEINDTKQTPGEVALGGFVEDSPPYRQDRYGGLIGECTRILQQIRRGINGIDIIEIESVNNLSGQEDTGRYRATMTIRLQTTASKIDTSY